MPVRGTCTSGRMLPGNVGIPPFGCHEDVGKGLVKPPNLGETVKLGADRISRHVET